MPRLGDCIHMAMFISITKHENHLPSEIALHVDAAYGNLQTNLMRLMLQRGQSSMKPLS